MCWVHSRVCGKHVFRKLQVVLCAGPLPRVRETRIRIHFLNVILGTTPAYAGSTCLSFFLLATPAAPPPACAGNAAPVSAAIPFSRNHPRACGKRNNDITRRDILRDPPPRVREISVVVGASPATVGATPACAGNAPHPASQGSDSRNHPRACGKH